MFASIMLSLMLFESPIQAPPQSVLLENPNGIYVDNNPTNGQDPYGLFTKSDHDKIIDLAFSDKSSSFRDIFKQASADVDLDQSPGGSYKHAMRSPNQSISDAKKKAEEYITKKVTIFRKLHGIGRTELATYELGQAFHTIMDSYSYEHVSFQVWRGLNGPIKLLEGLMHWLSERNASEDQLKRVAEELRRIYDEITDTCDS